jgi:cytochrome c biogenesis protein CcmG/thiol:disulfide interchange protein DsbE
LIGQPAPDLTLPYLERAGELSLADLRGDVVVVNFWASWCVPCREEHPALVAAADDYRSSGVTFVGIVYQDQPDQAIAFLDELGRAYDSLIDPDSAAAIEFGVFGVPETYLIDREGIVVGKVTGKSDYPLLAGMIEQTLAGEIPQSRMDGEVQAQP